MNSLIVFPEELIADDTALLEGERVRHVRETHDLEMKVRVRGAIYGEAICQLEIVDDAGSTPSPAVV